MRYRQQRRRIPVDCEGEMRQTNQAGVDLIKSFEGLRLSPYKDPVGLLTVGYGHLIKNGEHFGTLTEAEAEALLRADLHDAEAAVERLIKVPLTGNQHAALASFAFNLGEGNLAKSTLLRKLNAGDYAGAGFEFLKWNKAKGRVLPGLVRRRRAEMELFLASDQG